MQLFKRYWFLFLALGLVAVFFFFKSRVVNLVGSIKTAMQPTAAVAAPPPEPDRLAAARSIATMFDPTTDSSPFGKMTQSVISLIPGGSNILSNW